MPSVPQAFWATQLTVYVPTQLPQFTEADVEVVVNEVELLDENFGKTVPEGQIFVLGDNRHHAIDSRMRDLGCIDNDKIIGQVVMKIYPITRFSVY